MLYNPPHFRQTETDALIAEIKAGTGFATLVSNSAEGPVITHLPLLHVPCVRKVDPVSGKNAGETGEAGSGPFGRLIGHVARANPHWKIADLAIPSVAIFHGPDAYVSPGWYAAKKEHGKVVPTWNYAVIHATGRLVIHDDADWLRDIVTRLTEKHEDNQATPWAVTDAPEDFVRSQLKGIVGVELELTGIVGKKKLSQNRSEADRAGVIAGLADEQGTGQGPGAAGVLALMRG